MNHPRDLPNFHGFKFIGITADGEKQCQVVRDPETTCHIVTGEARFCDLIGWKRLPSKMTQEGE